MDPFILGALSSEIQRMRAFENASKQLLEIENQREQKRQYMKQVNEHVSAIIRDVAHQPIQSLVIVSLYMQYLNSFGVTPGAFETTEEQENVVLLWRKLDNLQHTLAKNLSKDQVILCRKCLDAILILPFIRAIDPNIRANEELKTIEQELIAAKNEIKRLRGKILLFVIGIEVGGVFALLIYLSSHQFKVTNVDLALWLVFALVLLCCALWLDGFRKPSLTELNYRRSQLIEQADVNNDPLWSQIEKAFGHYPTPDELMQRFEEANLAIQTVFPSDGSSEV